MFAIWAEVLEGSGPRLTRQSLTGARLCPGLGLGGPPSGPSVAMAGTAGTAAPAPIVPAASPVAAP